MLVDLRSGCGCRMQLLLVYRSGSTRTVFIFVTIVKCNLLVSLNDLTVILLKSLYIIYLYIYQFRKISCSFYDLFMTIPTIFSIEAVFQSL